MNNGPNGILARIMSQHLGDDDQPEKKLGIPLAQADDLKNRWARSRDVTTFKGGDLAREKDGLTTWDDRPVLLFWRYLDTSQDADKMLSLELLRSARDQADCLVARLTPEGGMAILSTESWRLERWDESMDPLPDSVGE